MSNPIPQDKERFAKLSPDKRIELPPGHTAPLDFRPTRTLIAERLAEKYPADGGLPPQVREYDETEGVGTLLRRQFFDPK